MARTANFVINYQNCQSLCLDCQFYLHFLWESIRVVDPINTNYSIQTTTRINTRIEMLLPNLKQLPQSREDRVRQHWSLAVLTGNCLPRILRRQIQTVNSSSFQIHIYWQFSAEISIWHFWSHEDWQSWIWISQSCLEFQDWQSRNIKMDSRSPDL